MSAEQPTQNKPEEDSPEVPWFVGEYVEMKKYTVTVYYDDETGGEFNIVAFDEESAKAYVINHFRMTNTGWFKMIAKENAE